MEEDICKKSQLLQPQNPSQQAIHLQAVYSSDISGPDEPVAALMRRAWSLLVDASHGFVTKDRAPWRVQAASKNNSTSFSLLIDRLVREQHLSNI